MPAIQARPLTNAERQRRYRGEGAPLPGASGRPVRITPHPGRCTRPGADGRNGCATIRDDFHPPALALYGAIRGNAGSVAGMEDSLFGKPARNFAPRTIWTGDNLDILRGISPTSA